MTRRLLATAAGLLLALAAAGTAAADGEAGIVIQDGEVVRTHCIAFAGEGITGDELLRRAGESFDAYGGGSGLALCSIGNRGCQDAGSFTSCFCECQGGDCTYWAFFTKEYGKNWVYSARAFNLLRAGDGDVHGWKWGKGGANTAPVPQDVSFEQVCGHAPRSGAAQPATATSPPASASTSAPTTVASLAPGSPTAALPSPSLPPSATPLATLPGTALPTPAVPETAAPAADSDDSSSAGGLIAFSVIAGGLVAAIAAAAVWRSRRGA